MFLLPHAVSVAFGLTASIIFIVVQIVVLVDFAHSWAENWWVVTIIKSRCTVYYRIGYVLRPLTCTLRC